MSKTNQSLKNVTSAFAFFFFKVVLSFFSRAIFIKALGSDLIGLNTTILNIVGMFNLAELGIYTAISGMLYKPLHEKDYATVERIVKIHKVLYRRIGLAILVLGLILLPILPFYLKNPSIPWYYVDFTFVVMLIGVLSSYFFNYRQILLCANQEGYKATNIGESISRLKVILQIGCVYAITDHVYLYWLLIELIMQVALVILLDKQVNKSFPWLSQVQKVGIDNTIKETLWFQIKRVFVYQVSKVVLINMSPVVVFYYLDFNTVTIYSNYMIILTMLTQISKMISSSVVASIGHLIAENNKTQERKVFFEYMALVYFFAGVLFVGYYSNINSLIAGIFGKQFLLTDQNVLFLSILIFVIGIRDVVETFLTAHAVYTDVLAPVFEVVIHIASVYILGGLYGLSGVIIGLIFSELSMFLWKPMFFSYKIRLVSVVDYGKRFVKYACILGFGGYVYFKFLLPLTGYTSSSLLPMLGNILINGSLIVIVYFLCFFVLDVSFRQLIARMVAVVRRR